MKKQQITHGSFWTIIKSESKRDIKIYPEKLLDFVSKNLGFYTYKDIYGTHQLVKVERGSIVKEISIEELKQGVKHYLRNEVKEEEVWAEFFKSNHINENFVANMAVLSEIRFNTSTKEKAIFYFRNGVVVVQLNEPVKLIPYEELNGYVWRQQIIDRDYKPCSNYEKSIFNQFLTKITGTRERYFGLASIMGYLLHPYKDPAYSRAVILLDEKLDFSGEAFGGTGKGIIALAIKSFTTVAWKDGKNFNNRENFAFDDIRPYHRVLIFDDVRKDFDLEFLYSFITGDLTAKRKYRDSITLAFATSPKVLIISNYMVKGTGGTTDARRRIEFELAPYFNSEHTPTDEFKHTLFDDWSISEWHLFDCLMLRFVAHYLSNGIPESSSESLKLNKLIMDTCPDFVEFMNERVELNVIYDKGQLYEEFKKYSPESKFISQIIFKKWIDKWAILHNYNVNHYKGNSKSKMTISTIN
jgi:hypothetical protein